MHACMYLYPCEYMCVCIVYVCASMHLGVSMHYVCVVVCVHACMHVCIYVCLVVLYARVLFFCEVNNNKNAKNTFALVYCDRACMQYVLSCQELDVKLVLF